MDDLIVANNTLALDLYSKFSKNGGNVFFSPYSISTALGMALEGARGETAQEMLQVLHLSMSDAERRQAVEEIHALLNREDAAYALNTANGLWVQEGYPLLEDYVAAVTGPYASEAHTVDFAKDTEGARQRINGWVENRTNDKIKDLIKPGVLSAITRLVLTNAVYFKGDWEVQFDKELTQDEAFHLPGGGTADVPMMRQQGSSHGYAARDGMQALELAYEGDDLSMLVLLPEDMTAFEQGLDTGLIRSLRDEMYRQKVDVYLPRFSFTANYGLKRDLAEMGMSLAFSGEADFSGIDGTRSLLIGDVIHQAFVDVNEEGTEAAAATAVVFELTCAAPEPTPVFRADRPFVLIIQENTTGEYLFMGKVENPAG